MKKAILSGLAIMFLMFGVTGITSATSFETTFSNTIDFDDNYSILDTVTYTHEILLTDFDPDLSTWDNLTLENATLEIKHFGNRGQGNEIWFSYGDNSDNNIELGKLDPSLDSWTIQSWNLEEDILNLLTNGTPWSLTISLIEDTSRTDVLQIDYSTLSGTASYDDGSSPAPEPATMILFGLGLLGITGVSRKKLQK